MQKAVEPENDAGFPKHNYNQLNCSCYSYPSRLQCFFRLHIFGIAKWLHTTATARVKARSSMYQLKMPPCRGANTTSVYPCRSCEIPRAHVRANMEKMRDCHLVARTCDNEVGVATSIHDPYTSPFTSRCK